MKSFLLVIAILGVSIGARAEGGMGKYWVVGSFNSLRDARIERVRLHKSLSEDVRVASFDVAGNRIYRLLVARSATPAAQKQHMAAAGITPWTVTPGPGGPDFVGKDKANAVRYELVAGSFASEANAQSLAHKLKGQGFAMVSTARDETSAGNTRYRVVLGPYEKRFAGVRQRLGKAGISGAWWLATAVEAPATMVASHSQMTKTKHVAPAPAPAAAPTPVAPAPAPAAPAVTPPAPDENLVTYCISKANALERKRFCTDAAFKRDHDRKLVANGARGKVYLDFCTREANASDREKYCTDKEMSQRTGGV